jgi:hypothetical protein
LAKSLPHLGKSQKRQLIKPETSHQELTEELAEFYLLPYSQKLKIAYADTLLHRKHVPDSEVGCTESMNTASNFFARSLRPERCWRPIAPPASIEPTQTVQLELRTELRSKRRNENKSSGTATVSHDTKIGALRQALLWLKIAFVAKFVGDTMLIFRLHAY